MIPLEVLTRKSLFSLLYKIDLDLAEQARARGCPFVGGLCTARIIRENLGVVLLILMRLLGFASACAVVGRVAVAGCCRHRCAFGGAGFTGRRSC